jgi:hypothetical protein
MRRLAGLLLLLGCAYLGHGFVLRWLAAPLVVDQTPPRVDCLWIPRDTGISRAAELYHQSPQRKIVVLQPRWNRLAAAGVLPTFDALVRVELGRRGVPAEAVTVIPGNRETAWDEVQGVGRWLEGRPGAELLVLVDRFQSARMRWLLDQALEPALASRIAVHALSWPEFDETNWWRSRVGVKAFMNGWITLLHVRRYGRLPASTTRWDPQAYLRWLAEPAAGAMP